MAEAQSKPNWFVIGISAAVVVVLIALGAVVVWMNNRATDAGPTPTADIINPDTGALTFGNGEKVIDSYMDLICPGCNAFEQAFGDRLKTLADQDKITFNMYPIAILDRLSRGTNYSSRAAASIYCVAEKNSDKALDYVNLLYENQPEENSTGLTDEQLIDFAKKAGATDAPACITDGTYLKFGAAQAKKYDINGSPTIKLNGEIVEGQSLQEAFDKVDAWLKAIE